MRFSPHHFFIQQIKQQHNCASEIFAFIGAWTITTHQTKDQLKSSGRK
jgi:hypothetical protein